MLRLSNVRKSYGKANAAVPVLHDVTLKISGGEFCAIVGPSGSGKSTLLNIIGLLDRPDAGEVWLDDRVIDLSTPAKAARLRNELIGFVFQSFQLLPRLTACENAALPLMYRGVPGPERLPRAIKWLERLGLGDRLHHLPTELSGGQRQRVALARALICDPKLILADEPTGSLDSVTAAEVLSLLKQLNKELGVTIVMVTHDHDIAAHCGRRIEMRDGLVVMDSLPQ